jgi:hypothetical protein
MYRLGGEVGRSRRMGRRVVIALADTMKLMAAMMVAG